ncbi:hypothetical protein BN1708_020548, partial [Verticillium longisporum]
HCHGPADHEHLGQRFARGCRQPVDQARPCQGGARHQLDGEAEDAGRHSARGGGTQGEGACGRRAVWGCFGRRQALRRPRAPHRWRQPA